MQVRSPRPQPRIYSNPTPPPRKPPGGEEEFHWDRALALPAGVFGGASAIFSGLTHLAEKYPPGGVQLDPTRGLVRNPEFTRPFTYGRPGHQLQPMIALASTAIHGIKGTLEFSRGLETGDRRLQWAGALDMGIAAGSALSLLNPGAGAAVTVGLLGLRSVF